MNELWPAILLQVVGLVLLLLEAFVPSHGLLGLTGLVALGGGIYLAFRFDPTAGYMSSAAAVLAVPTITITGLKVFRRTPLGRRVAPPNPMLTAADTSVDMREARHCIGRRGRALSPLRPVGVGEFGGRRIQCVAEHGLIEPGAEIEGIAIVGGSLAVRPVHSARKA